MTNFITLLSTVLLILIINVEASFADQLEENVKKLQEEINLATMKSQNYDWPTRKNFEETFDMSKYPQVDDNATYDFVIVGAGAAGSVIASRLSEESQFKVLLLEAGNYGNSVLDIPKFSSLFINSDYNWNFTLERQDHACLGKNDNVCSVNAGRAVGGSTAVNDMIWTRGTALDYRYAFQNVTSQWNLDEILNTFIEMENAHFNYSNPEMHGTQGPVHLENPQINRLDHTHIFGAAKELNIPEIDYNDWHMSSMPNYIGQVQCNTRQGRRWSTATAYLKSKPNLIVRPNAHVLQLDINEDTVQRVTYFQDGKIVNVKVGKEVILSAGAVNSPKLLQLSGIGPKQLLKELGIDVKVDLPSVGCNLKTQVYFNGLTFLQNKNANETNKNSTDLKKDIEEYLKGGKGSLTWASSELISFLSNDNSDIKSNIELTFVPGANNAGYDDLKVQGVKENIYDSLYRSTEGKSGFQLVVILLHPLSSGSVKIKSKNPMAQPKINVNLFNHPLDIEYLVDGIQMALNFTKTEEFKQLDVQLNENKLLECGSYENDKYWQCMLRHLAAPTQHLTGTSRIGNNNSTSVVDEQLRVHGMKNLRVADAGILPDTVTGHTMAPTVMIGEMAAKIIKRYYST